MNIKQHKVRRHYNSTDCFNESCGKVEAIESFDDAEGRTLESPLEASSLTSGRLGTKQTQTELSERGGVFLGPVEQSGQGVGECRQVEIDGELDELIAGVGGSRASY